MMLVSKTVDAQARSRRRSLISMKAEGLLTARLKSATEDRRLRESQRSSVEPLGEIISVILLRDHHSSRTETFYDVGLGRGLSSAGRDDHARTIIVLFECIDV